MSAANSTTLVLTVQEHTALSVALKTALRLWGDSEEKAQEKVRGKLKSIVRKLYVLAATATGGSAEFPDRR
jgi:hypothetical protein